ncbi:hypothetical protein GCM10009715_06010 [Paeniglutamicibacter psychrophenolicus]|uniref:DUF998 domain-containing protein n=1 Tax=Paeniglutamicibacter psychrophenolicus TaxID=257454 RepID=A0ABS4WEC4_9MICC|nr:hypothetical protein [Paeniglutamicibacter psychrophenolicus]MBP2374396.1 hypothetical protein [Paeniglutamicibacter psychrophenolicus]
MGFTMHFNPVHTTGSPRRAKVPAPGEWAPWVRVVAGAIPVLAFAAQLVNRSLFDMSSGYQSLFLEQAQHPALLDAAVIAGVFAPALLMSSVLVWFRLGRDQAPVAAWISLVSGVLAFTCLPALSGYSVSALAMGSAHLGTGAVAAALSDYRGLPALVLFAVYNLASLTAIMAACRALWRSARVSRFSVAMLGLFMVADIAGVLPFDAHYLGLVAALSMAWSMVARPRRYRPGGADPTMET